MGVWTRVAVMLVAGCGSGGNSSPTTQPLTVVPGSAPTPAPSPAPSPTPTAPAVSAQDATLLLGTQTHFSQGWPISSVDKAKAIHATLLRDGIGWSAGEPTPGAYDFNSGGATKIAEACRAGMRFILTIVPDNDLYDGGHTVYSAAGMSAYAGYLNAIADHYGDCIVAFEIGNEINNGAALDYPDGADAATQYVDLLKVVHDKVKAAHPGIAILGGSSNMIATGFLTPFFEQGMLKVVDGIAVHPYRSHAEGVDIEISHLVDVMKGYGTPVPIWATEFSNNLADGAAAAGELVKMMTLLRTAGVERSIWYALVDQQYFPNMGLYHGDDVKPAGSAFAMLQSRLLPLGQPRRVDIGDPLVFAYRYGNDAWVVWGAPRRIRFNGNPSVVDAAGKAISASGLSIGPEPIVAFGASGLTAEGGDMIADSLLQYGQKPWSYVAQTADGADHQLSLFDDRYTSYFGGKYYKPLRIDLGGAAPAGAGKDGIRAVVRYTAPAAATVDVSACLTKAAKGDGVDWRLEHNGSVIQSGVMTGKLTLNGIAVTLAAGDRIDLSVGPNAASGGDSFEYRVELFRHGSNGTLACS